MSVRPPLRGRRLLVTRPRSASRDLAALLEDAGATVVWRPLVRIARPASTDALDRTLRALASYAWVVFTSAHGVAAVMRRVPALGLEPPVVRSRRIAVVGPATAAAALRHGLPVHVVATPHSAAGLVSALTPNVEPGVSVLHPRSEGASPALVDGLRRLGARVVDPIAYRTVALAANMRTRQLLATGIDGVVFCSPSAVRAAEPYRHVLGGAAVACIGPTTAAAATGAGWVVSVVPPAATAPALVVAVARHFVLAGARLDSPRAAMP